MLNRNAILVAGAAIFALDASAAVAQDTTRMRPTSTQRISIRKESGGEVTVRVDTVYSYRTDTLQLPGRVDTVTTTRTITRVDTVEVPIPLRLMQVGGLYLGLGVGSAVPAANFNDSDHPGWMVEGTLGFDPIGSWLGARLNASYSRFSPHDWISPFLDDADIFSASLDGKLRVLTISPFNRRVQVYGVGGASWNRFRNILETNDDDVLSVGSTIIVPGTTITTIDDDWHSGWGYNLGGGAEIGLGRANLFVEARYTNFDGQNSRISRVPLLIGLNWFGSARTITTTGPR